MKSSISVILPTENQESKAFIKWIRLTPLIRDVTIHISNEGKRSPWLAQSMGIKEGVSDFFIAYPINGYHGLWIEMKKRKGYRETRAQKAWIELMKSFNYAAHFAYGWEMAKDIVERYIGNK